MYSGGAGSSRWGSEALGRKTSVNVNAPDGNWNATRALDLFATARRQEVLTPGFSRRYLRLAHRDGHGQCVRFSGNGERLELVGDLTQKASSIV